MSETSDEASRTPPEVPWFRWAIAFVWLSTAVAVLHPAYRQIGGAYLARLGLPDWLMFVTCAGELALGLRVGRGPSSTWLTTLQLGTIGVFTLTLAALEPSLLAHPFGVLSKNVPLAALIGGVWLLEREGWTPRAEWLLRVGMAVVWLSEGLIPKILFQQEYELEVVRESGLVSGDAGVFLMAMGGAQIVSGVLALALRGRWQAGLLTAQVTALFFLPLLVSSADLTLWVHPFGPLTKNVPILVGTAALALRSWGSRRGSGVRGRAPRARR